MAATVYKQFAFLRTAFYLLITAVSLVFPVIAEAETNPAYTVEGVEVDAVAENAVKAREKALDEAQVKAYQILAERFLTPDELKTFKVPDPVTISSVVQDFEVTKEQLSTKRYKGTYTIRFRPNAMKMQMASQGKVYSDQIRKPALVLPFYQVGGSTMLWGETNPWMMAWRNMPTDRSMMQPTVVPLGDAADISYVSNTESLNYDPMQVQALASKYNAEDVAILLASTEPTQTANGRLVVNIYSNGFEGPKFTQKVVIDQLPNEDANALFSRAAMQVKAILRQNWKANAAYTAPPPATTTTTTTVTTYGQPPVAQTPPPAIGYTRPALGQSQNYVVQARFASVQDWVRMKNTLDRVYGVQAVMIKALKPREALLDLRFAGALPQLQLALQNAGITMRAAGVNMPLEIYMGQQAQQPIYR